MKPVLIISLIALSGLGIGLFQHSRLADLKAETATLQRSATHPSRREDARPVEAEKVQSSKSQAEIEAMMVHTFEMIAKSRGSNRPSQAEQAEAMEAQRLLFTTFAGLDHLAVFDLIEKLKTSGTLPAELRDNIAAGCLEILMQVNPKEALGLLQLFGNFPANQQQINQAFNQWASGNPGQALRWFEEESKKGNPLTAIPGMAKSAMLVRARVDPARALSHEQFEKLIANPEDSANLGANIAATLHDPRENSGFLAALRREQEKSPGSPSLAKIRSDYLGELCGRIDRWTFEEASGLIDSEFSPDEKLAAVSRLSSVGDFAEPALWADWFAKIEVPKDTLHPLNGFVLGWMHGDPVAAGKWLENAPPSGMKDSLAFNYAFVVVDADPTLAMQWVMKIPEGKLRTRALREIGKKWQAKDPSAASAFALEHDLAE